MTTDVKDLMGRLALQPGDIGGPSYMQMMRDRDEAAAALKAQAEEIARLKEERAFAIREMSKWASACGEAEGRLKASQWPGVIDDWRERSEAAERERAEEWRKRREAEGDRDVSNAAALTLREERDALKAENEKLRGMLEPLAAEADAWGDAVPDDHRPVFVEMGHWDARYYGSAARFTVGDQRRARAALHPTQGGE